MAESPKSLNTCVDHEKTEMANSNGSNYKHEIITWDNRITEEASMRNKTCGS
jgi:hypothetical protein